MMNGRRYSEDSPPVGTQAPSTASSSRSDARNSSSGSRGMPSRTADRFSRAAFCSGRNEASEPSGCAYAFSPSKISWP